jgi:predicted helicase
MSKATIYYRDIGDSLSREEKLAIIKKTDSIAILHAAWFCA